MAATENNGAAPRGRWHVSRMFCEVNTRIREAAGRSGGEDPWDFICECDDLDCVETVSLSLDDYDTRRAKPASRIVVDHA
jgi:hypothetical protein